MTPPVENVRSELFLQESATSNTYRLDTLTGEYKGEAVRVIDPSLSLQDAAEEMTFGASETRETEDKKLTDRADPRKRQWALQVQKVVQFSKDFDQEAMARLLRKLKTMPMQNPAELNAAVQNAFKEAFPDATLRHTALYLAQEHCDDTPELGAALADAQAQLEQEQGPAIVAGYTVAGVVTPDFTAGDAEKRQIYRDTVLQYAGCSPTFMALAQRYGEKELPGALQFLTTALGADIAALSPSAPPEALKEILEGLETAHTLTTFYAETCRLLHHMETTFAPHKLTPQSLMEPLLKLKDQTQITTSHIREQMPFLESFDPRRDATLTQGVMTLAHTLPHAAFVSQESRQQLLDALQIRLDATVQREDGAAS